MTLRELLEKAHSSYEDFVTAIANDINRATNDSPIDWPIYLLLLVLLVALIAWIIIRVALSFCNLAWGRFWKKHYDLFERPTTGFGRFINLITELAGHLGSLILVWILAYIFFSVALQILNPINSMGVGYLIYGLPTFLCGVLAILAAKGRNNSRNNRK